MKGSKGNNLVAATALVLSAGWAIAWVGGLLVDSGSWVARIGLLSVGLTMAGGATMLLWHRARRNRRAAERHFEALCRIDLGSFDGQEAQDDPSPLPADNPWSGVANRVREVFLEARQRTQELKHTRSAWEIRCHRATDQQEQIKAIFSGLDEPILAIDAYDELMLANRSAEQLLKFDADDPETRLLSQVIDCQKLVDLLTATSHRKTSGHRTEEVEISDAHGNPRWYRATATKLADDDDTGQQESASEDAPRGATVAVLRDIGDQKALQKRNAEFVSALSHEMKTPLAGIKAYVELLVDGDAEDEQTQEEFLNVINGQADRLQRLIDNLLNLARIEAGVVNVNKQSQSLNDLLEEAFRIVQPAAEAKQIELVAELSPMYLGVLADRDMLLQSAINLLSNAIKYTQPQGRVTLRSRLNDNHVRFEVEDTGVGLSEEDCQRVFEKFYRVKKSKEMASGTGLGLPLAKHIVEDVHGGRLFAESTLDRGSTFIVTMPSAGQLA